MGECGYQDYHIDYIWRQIEAAVVKTILVALPEMRKEFHETADLFNYNTYKILGYDMLIDDDLNVHVIEVNGRPQLQVRQFFLGGQTYSKKITVIYFRLRYRIILLIGL